MDIYLVGGAVRDELLGYPFHEKDWVVVGSNSQKMLAKGYVSVGKDFPVFLHPTTKEEYALARLERKTGHGYAGFDFTAEESVTLEQDLARRDLTINAIAKNTKGELVDPYGGKNDLDNRCLRHVSESFKEDPVRILRTARFAARYHHLGFTIASETLELMKEMVSSGEADYLVAERVWQECQKALSEQNPQIFIKVLKSCGALKVIFPEINCLFGVPQPEKHHPEIDCGAHALMSLKQGSLLSTKTHVRFACLTHDLGKAETPASVLPQHINHEKRGLPILKSLCERLKIPNVCNELAQLVMQYHTHCHRAFELNEKTLMKLLESLDAFRRPQRFQEFLICCKADAKGRTGYESRNYIQANYLQGVFITANQVQARHLIDKGFSGIKLGEEIRQERIRKIKTFKQNIGA